MRSDKMCALAGLNEKKLRNFFLVHEKFFEKKKIQRQAMSMKKNKNLAWVLYKIIVYEKTFSSWDQR